MNKFDFFFKFIIQNLCLELMFRTYVQNLESLRSVMKFEKIKNQNFDIDYWSTIRNSLEWH